MNQQLGKMYLQLYRHKPDESNDSTFALFDQKYKINELEKNKLIITSMGPI